MGGSILGERVLRKEDPKFLTTGGVYVDDMLNEPLLAGALHATYVRSTVAHANIGSIDVADALEMPGVVAIYTAADLELTDGFVAERVIREWIDFYNGSRPHSALGGCTPAAAYGAPPVDKGDNGSKPS